MDTRRSGRVHDLEMTSVPFQTSPWDLSGEGDLGKLLAN